MDCHSSKLIQKSIYDPIFYHKEKLLDLMYANTEPIRVQIINIFLCTSLELLMTIDLRGFTAGKNLTG